jgi:hypothetical protein
MKAQLTIAKPERIGGRWSAVGGALVILALASGLALGLGAVVDRLTMPDDDGRVLSVGAGQDSTIASAAGGAGLSNRELPATARVSVAHVVDRRPVEQDGATAWSLRDQYQFRDGGIQSSVQLDEIAPNELRLSGR